MSGGGPMRAPSYICPPPPPACIARIPMVRALLRVVIKPDALFENPKGCVLTEAVWMLPLGRTPLGSGVSAGTSSTHDHITIAATRTRRRAMRRMAQAMAVYATGDRIEYVSILRRLHSVGIRLMILTKPGLHPRKRRCLLTYIPTYCSIVVPEPPSDPTRGLDSPAESFELEA
eukprot:3189400-Pleurochrysis_carterae.AAC.2